MAQAEIFAGICGFKTIVTATMDGEVCKLAIESDCKAIQKLAGELNSSGTLQGDIRPKEYAAQPGDGY